MARTYKRDSNGRFASTGSTRSGPKARMASRGTNRITRDNAGRITSVGGQGATARGGRLRTAGGNLRGRQVARLKGAGGKVRRPSGTVAKPRGLRPGALKARSKPAAARQAKPAASQRAASLRARAADLQQRGNTMMSGGRQDRAAVNAPLSSRSRQNETSAGFRGLELTRQAARLESKARGIEARSLESRAKKLRAVHSGVIAKSHGVTKARMESALKLQPPAIQIKAIKKWVKDNRGTAQQAPRRRKR